MFGFVIRLPISIKFIEFGVFNVENTNVTSVPETRSIVWCFIALTKRRSDNDKKGGQEVRVVGFIIKRKKVISLQ